MVKKSSEFCYSVLCEKNLQETKLYALGKNFLVEHEMNALAIVWSIIEEDKGKDIV